MVELQPNLFTGHEFHHIGYATTSLEKERECFGFLGYQQEGDDFIDPVQGVVGCFITGPGPRIELLKNLPGSNILTPWLNAGIKMYHFAYLVESNLDEVLSRARVQRAKITMPPVAAVAFCGRRISFVTFRQGLMVEFIEKNIPIDM